MFLNMFPFVLHISVFANNERNIREILWHFTWKCWKKHVMFYYETQPTLSFQIHGVVDSIRLIWN